MATGLAHGAVTDACWCAWNASSESNLHSQLGHLRHAHDSTCVRILSTSNWPRELIALNLQPVHGECGQPSHWASHSSRWVVIGWNSPSAVRAGLPTQTLRDSYALFTSLRQRGVRAHSWV